MEASIRQQDTGYHVTAAVSGNTIQVTFVTKERRQLPCRLFRAQGIKYFKMRVQVMQQHLQIPLLQVKERQQRQLLHQKSTEAYATLKR